MLWLGTFMHFNSHELISFRIIFNESVESCIQMEHCVVQGLCGACHHNHVKWQGKYMRVNVKQVTQRVEIVRWELKNKWKNNLYGFLIMELTLYSLLCVFIIIPCCTWECILLFLDAVAKSAPLPLQLWLPEDINKCCKVSLTFINFVLHCKWGQCQTKYFMIEERCYIGGI
jgi:hypothetical protein